MSIPRNLSKLADGADTDGVLGVANGGTGATSLSSITVGNATNAVNATNATTATTATSATTATNLASGSAGTIPYQTASGTTAMLAAGSSGQLLSSNGTSAPSWVAAPSTSPAGSTGQVQYNNAGAFGALPDGTSGQVLTSAGSGSAPTWSSPAAGGSWIYLSTVTASNSATVTIDSTFNSTYQVYALVVSNLRGSNGSESLYMLNGFNSIGYVENEYRYHLNQSNSGSTAYSASATTAGSVVAYRVMNNVSAEVYDSAQFIMYIHNPSSTTSYKGVYSIGVSQNSTAITQNMVGWCTTGSNYALTGLRFYMGSGNIVNGTFRLYGIKNS